MQPNYKPGQTVWKHLLLALRALKAFASVPSPPLPFDLPKPLQEYAENLLVACRLVFISQLKDR